MANNTPNVSIIMPAYNSRNTIGASIQSVISQTFTDWELLIIDDCSPETMKDIADSFHDERIKYIRLLKNSGVAAARNMGISQAKGRYIAFLDSDDFWLPEKLEKQLQFMQNNGYAFTYTWYRQFEDDPAHPIRLVKTKNFVDYRKLLRGNDIGCLTVMIDRKQIPEIHMPSEKHEDYITWLNLLKKGYQAYSLQEDLARYRLSQHSVSGDKKKSLVWTWKVYRESQGLSILEAGFYFICYVIGGLKKHFF
ncbi:glycosyltransferase family 2 protein [Acidaminococcus timonensis]|uniref:glycosyltransferase family 2 protein n=1 Tax=Acidaminococcus timonensis TaxID=1871002 RepID=UPI0025D296E1|nr:glycosyltransferase family 2 protein [Acidaminococcus timonensis]